MRTRHRLRAAGVGYLPMLLTIATLAPLAGGYHLGAGIVLLGAAVCLTARPTPPPATAAGPGRHAVAIIATTVGVAVLALAFSRSMYLGDGLYVSILLAARLVGGFGARWAALGRALLLPLTALFLAPPVRVPGGLLAHLLWALVACLVASVWIVVVPAVLPEPRPRSDEVARAARAVAAGRRGAARRLTAAVAALDLALARRGGDDARAALLRLQVAAQSGADVAAATRDLASLIASRSTAERVVDTVDPADAPSARARRRLALASAAGVTLALVGGQLLFPRHWPWTVVTVIAVSLGSASRGEVLVRSGQRFLGALAATALISPLAAVLAPYRAAMVLAMLAVIGLGWYLRSYSRVWWTAALTSMLALAATLTDPNGDPLRLLGVRLVAICVGGVCAIVPALLLAPATRDVLRKRTAICLRRLGNCLAEPTPDALAAGPDLSALAAGPDLSALAAGPDLSALAAGPGVAAVRRFDAALADLGTAEWPVRLLRRRAPERRWYVSLQQAAPVLHASVARGEAAPPALRRLLRSVAGEVRRPAPVAAAA